MIPKWVFEHDDGYGVGSYGSGFASGYGYGSGRAVGGNGNGGGHGDRYVGYGSGYAEDIV